MTEQPVIVQKVSWGDLCPWTLIFKTLPIASSLTVLAFALLGVVLTPMGWLLSETLCIDKNVRNDTALMRLAEINRSPYRGVFLTTDNSVETIGLTSADLSGPRSVFQQLVRPFQYLFDSNFELRQFLYLLLGCVWSLFVWTFVGLAITRVSLIRLTRNEQTDMDEAFGFAMEKWLTAAGAIGIPLIAVAVLCIPGFLLGVVMGFDAGVLFAGVVWVFVLAIATAMGMLLFGLMFGWPLMVSSVACEGQNSFDAMTRAYAYVFQRPLHYVMYSVVAILFGGFCWLIVATMTNGIVDLSFWASSWGTNLVSTDRIDLINGITDAPPSTPESWSMSSGRNMIGLWNALFRTLAAAFVYGLFWCMASAVYLLLRKDVDETEMDEIFIDDQKRTYELPPLQSDENGIPQVLKPGTNLDGDSQAPNGQSENESDR